MAPPIDPETGASRASAYVYGTILVQAALIALHPDDLSTSKGVLYVLGTAVSTFIAHLLSESVGTRIRHREAPSQDEIRHEIRNAVPIASAAAGPVLLLAAAWAGWIAPLAALLAAQLVTIGRMLFIGSVTEHLRGEKSSARIMSAGVALAVLSALVSGLKLLLTH